MDWADHGITLFASLLGSGLGIPVAAWLGQTWLGHRLELVLEHAKADLQVISSTRIEVARRRVDAATRFSRCFDELIESGRAEFDHEAPDPEAAGQAFDEAKRELLPLVRAAEGERLNTLLEKLWEEQEIRQQYLENQAAVRAWLEQLLHG